MPIGTVRRARIHFAISLAKRADCTVQGIAAVNKPDEAQSFLLRFSKEFERESWSNSSLADAWLAVVDSFGRANRIDDALAAARRCPTDVFMTVRKAVERIEITHRGKLPADETLPGIYWMRAAEVLEKQGRRTEATKAFDTALRTCKVGFSNVDCSDVAMALVPRGLLREARQVADAWERSGYYYGRIDRATEKFQVLTEILHYVQQH